MQLMSYNAFLSFWANAVQVKFSVNLLEKKLSTVMPVDTELAKKILLATKWVQTQLKFITLCDTISINYC